jgi:hypothetical protein
MVVILRDYTNLKGSNPSYLKLRKEKSLPLLEKETGYKLIALHAMVNLFI